MKIKYLYNTSELNQVKQHKIKLTQILNHIDQLILGWCVGLWETRFSIPYYTQLTKDHQMQKKFEKNVGSSIIFFNFDLHNFSKIEMVLFIFRLFSTKKWNISSNLVNWFVAVRIYLNSSLSSFLSFIVVSLLSFSYYWRPSVWCFLSYSVRFLRFKNVHFIIWVTIWS